MAKTRAESELLNRSHVNVWIDLISEMNHLIDQCRVGLPNSNHTGIKHQCVLGKSPALPTAHVKLVTVQEVRQLTSVAVMEMTFLDVQERVARPEPAKQSSGVLHEISVRIAKNDTSTEFLKRMPRSKHLSSIVHPASASPSDKVVLRNRLEVNW